MDRYVLGLVIIVGLIGASGSVVHAGTVTLNNPAPGSAVGRSILLSGSATPNAQYAVTIDGKSYVLPGYRGQLGGEFPSGGTVSANGRFSITLDLTGNAVVDANGFQSVPDGSHTIAVEEFFFDSTMANQEPGRAQTIVTLRTAGAPSAGSVATRPPTSDDQAVSVAPRVQPTPSPTPTSSPTASPLLTPTATLAGQQQFPVSAPVVVLGLSALAMLGVYLVHHFTSLR